MPLSNDHILDFDSLPETIKDALKEYQQSVELLSGKKLNLEFNNKDQYHASIVMAAIFNTAETSIKIFCGSFSGEVSDNPMYLQALTKALDNNVTVDVVTESSPNKKSKCFQLLKNKKNEGKKIDMFVLDADYRKKVQARGSEYLRHFTLGDDRMFRYETETNSFKAICNFDDKLNVDLLSHNFAYLKSNSTELQVD